MNNLINDINRAITPDEPVRGARAASKPLPPTYYDYTKTYWTEGAHDNFVPVNAQAAADELIVRGYSPSVDRKAGETMSEVDVTLVRIRREHNVDYAGELAGFRAGYHDVNGVRVLATKSPAFVVPRPGAWDLVREVLTNLLGREQLIYFFAWLKVALEMFTSGIYQPGQALFLVGEAGAGKNLLRTLVTKMCGGRVAFPHAFMMARTAFSADLFGAEILAIEDQQEGSDYKSRRHFAAAIKDLVANREKRCERKHCNPIPLTAHQRLIVSLNDDPERMGIVPTLDDDIADKMMIFRVEKHPMPMPTRTGAQCASYQSALFAELPMFAHFLTTFEIPAELIDHRFGVAAYHNPVIVEHLHETTNEVKLLLAIETELLANDSAWEGSAMDLESALTHETSTVRRAAEQLLRGAQTAGTYLARLKKQMPDRVSRRKVNGKVIWTVRADPATVAARTAAATQHAPKSSDAVANLREKLKAMQP